MGATFQIVIDGNDPERLVRFWTLALDYIVEPPPDGRPTWRDYWLSIGVPADELGDGDCADSIIDPAGIGPRIWFQLVPEVKASKNRLHIDVRASSGRGEPLAARRAKVDAKVAQLVQAGATPVTTHAEPGVDHYGVTLRDPEGNEFCVN